MADLDRRETLLAAMEAAEEGTLEAPEEKEIDQEPLEAKEDIQEHSAEEPIETEASAENREESTQDIQANESEESDEKPQEIEPQRPSTWKKEYVQLWDKMKDGQQISKEDFVKFAEYANQRESEYKKGVSVYKAEAEASKKIMEAVAPFEQSIRSRGLEPSQYVSALAKADQILTHAPYQQKVQLFQKLAQDYGIQFNGESVAPAQQLDPYTQQLMNQLNQVNQEVSSIKGRFAQEENQRLMNEIQKYQSDTVNYPHFDMVREDMAQLLERGLAQDLEAAYKKAVRMNDDVWSKEQERLLSTAKQEAIKAQQVKKAKAAAVSPKSVTPSGSVSAGDKKDRRSLLAEQLGEATSRL